MKKLLWSLMILTLLVGFSSCSSDDDTVTPKRRFEFEVLNRIELTKINLNKCSGHMLDVCVFTNTGKVYYLGHINSFHSQNVVIEVEQEEDFIIAGICYKILGAGVKYTELEKTTYVCPEGIYKKPKVYTIKDGEKVSCTVDENTILLTSQLKTHGEVESMAYSLISD